MHQHVQNGWFHSVDLDAATQAIHKTAHTEPTRWLEHGIDCKYVQVQVDMRTGDFIIKNAFGDRLNNVDILKMFPELGPIEPIGV